MTKINNLNELLTLNISELAGVFVDCLCGRVHSSSIGRIVVGSGVNAEIPSYLQKYKSSRIFLVADNNTYRICGKKILCNLQDAGFNCSLFVYETGDEELVPDERTVGRLLIEIRKDTDLLLAVGSGVINDIARTVAYKMKIPFAIIGTAPSMDGYASVVSPLIIGGIKESVICGYPEMIIADVDIAKDAPHKMHTAGVGDIIGKLIAIADWNLSRILNGEHYCQFCAEMVLNSVKKVILNAGNIAKREAEAIEFLLEALIIAGLAIGFYGASRPASGTEHYFAHYWDADAIARGKSHPLHGNSVGSGTYIAAHIYHRMKDLLPSELCYPEPSEVKTILDVVGAASNPRDLGISRELFERSMLHAIDGRPKYTILNLAKENGRLIQITEELTNLFYD
ncbi:MAG: sn-glycerol-1-phosphate dehydrogenase [Clostridiales bacterium]|nr:sn-glycerol-1-phosphate dehydrogenase [Clostridiales bacterium]